MKFDKSKVYTPFNSEGLKIGSRGYIGDHAKPFEHNVSSENVFAYGTLTGFTDDYPHSFRVALDKGAKGTIHTTEYFYLVEEPKEPTKRPCTREELVEMLKKQGLPMIYCGQNDVIYNIVHIEKDKVILLSPLSGSMPFSYKELCEHYTLLDGTELWIKEKTND